jgi:hypothetical protein
MTASNPRTTISLKSTTKTKLDKWKAAGQCYDGFLSQLLQMWEMKKTLEKRQETV